MSELNLIFLGSPGSGKGTQAQRLMDDFDLAYIATGDMLREHVKQGTPLGAEAKRYMDSGDLVPDDVIIAMITETLNDKGAHDGFILDGFPRTIAQADALGKQLAALGKRLTAVLLIEVPDEEVDPPALRTPGQRHQRACVPHRVRSAKARGPLRRRRLAAHPA